MSVLRILRSVFIFYSSNFLNSSFYSSTYQYALSGSQASCLAHALLGLSDLIYVLLLSWWLPILSITTYPPTSTTKLTFHFLPLFLPTGTPPPTKAKLLPSPQLVHSFIHPFVYSSLALEARTLSLPNANRPINGSVVYCWISLITFVFFSFFFFSFPFRISRPSTRILLLHHWRSRIEYVQRWLSAATCNVHITFTTRSPAPHNTHDLTAQTTPIFFSATH